MQKLIQWTNLSCCWFTQGYQLVSIHCNKTGEKNIQFVGGIKNMLFGGEGVFFATLRGPGEVWLQSLPISRLASRILSYGTTQRKEEGSILGGLGNLLDGDGR